MAARPSARPPLPAANRCAFPPLPRSDLTRSTTWLHPRTGEPVNSGHMIRSGGCSRPAPSPAPRGRGPRAHRPSSLCPRRPAPRLGGGLLGGGRQLLHRVSAAARGCEPPPRGGAREGAGWGKLGAGLRRLLQRGRQQVSPGRLLGWLVGFCCCCFFFSFPIFLVLKSAARGRWSANRPRAGCVGAACVGAGRAALAARPEGAASARGSARCERQLSARCGGSGARGSAPMWLVMKRPPRARMADAESPGGAGRWVWSQLLCVEGFLCLVCQTAAELSISDPLNYTCAQCVVLTGVNSVLQLELELLQKTKRVLLKEARISHSGHVNLAIL